MMKMKFYKTLLFSAAAAVLLVFCSGCMTVNHVFIDGGAHFGESLTAFKTTELYKKSAWQIYAIEANPDFIIRIPKADDIKVIGKAMWVYDGNIDFYLSEPGKTQSSLYNKEGLNKKRIVVECFDFGKWLKDNFKTRDYIILSLDIAGGEWELLEKMLADGSIKYIDRLYVEFSSEMFTEERLYQRQYAIIQEVRELNIIFDADSAEDVIGWRQTWQDEL